MLDRNTTRCARIVREALSEDVVTALARESGFARRVRKFTPLRAAWTFLVGLASGSTNTLADFLRLFTDLSQETMAYKPFHDRLSTVGFPEFFRLLLGHLMSELVSPVYGCNNGYLAEFEDILCQDGTSFALNDRMAAQFKGRFTSRSPAAVEVHCTYSLYQNQCVAVSVAPDAEGERDFLPDPEELENKLLLADAGYVSYEYFNRVREAGGHIICRAKGAASNPRIVGCYRGLPNVDTVIGKRLKEIVLPRKNVDLLVEGIGRDRRSYRMRLVGVYVAKEKAHVFLFTTLSPKEFVPLRVGTLYRLRWQVELFFKECKSYTNLQRFRTANPRIAEGLIWASMAAVLIRRFLLHAAFDGTGKRCAPFVAAALSWTYVRDLGRAAMDGYHDLKRVLRRILKLLYDLARRTNPHRRDAWKDLGIEPEGAPA